MEDLAHVSVEVTYDVPYNCLLSCRRLHKAGKNNAAAAVTAAREAGFATEEIAGVECTAMCKGRIFYGPFSLLETCGVSCHMEVMDTEDNPVYVADNLNSRELKELDKDLKKLSSS